MREDELVEELSRATKVRDKAWDALKAAEQAYIDAHRKRETAWSALNAHWQRVEDSAGESR